MARDLAIPAASATIPLESWNHAVVPSKPSAVVKLVRQLKGEVVGLQFVIELDFLKGREKLPGLDVQALVHY